MQNGDKICGYSWDYVKAEKQSYCKAYFTGHYDKEKGKWVLQSSSFIENSGGHMLMRMSLGNHNSAGEDILEGVSVLKSILLTMLTGGANDDVYLKKTSGKPQQILERMKDCFPKEKKINDTLVKKDTIAKPITVIKPVDTIVTITPPLIVIKDSITIPKELVKRKNTEQSHIEVNVKSITLNVYDNAIVDGDTISVFYNGKLLLSHQRLSEKPIVINLELDEKQTRHEIILFAENLGSIPPNTALIVIYAGDKRYELFSSASLEENAVLVFDYKPK
ncbi:MAG: hypothetical protein ABI666_11655 [Ferruginibacter sp.]